MADVTVREATEEDCGDILRMIKELAAHQNKADRVAIDEHVLKRDGFGETQYFHCFVAEQWTQVFAGEDERHPLVGYAMYYFTYSPWSGRTCCLEDLYVQPQWRGKGVGVSLWAHVTKTALERECAFVQWVVLDWNQEARDFYQRNGARDVSHEEGWLLYRMTRDSMETFVAKRLPQTA